MDVVRRADVAEHTHGDSVAGLVGQAFQALQKLTCLPLVFHLVQKDLTDVIFGIDDDIAVGAVDYNLAAGIFGLHLVSDTYDCRDTHCAGKDCSMARAASTLCDEAQDLGLVQLDGLARGKVIGSQDDGNR